MAEAAWLDLYDCMVGSGRGIWQALESKETATGGAGALLEIGRQKEGEISWLFSSCPSAVPQCLSLAKPLFHEAYIFVFFHKANLLTQKEDNFLFSLSIRKM